MTQENALRLLKHYKEIGNTLAHADMLSRYPSLEIKEEPKEEPKTKSKGKKHGSS